MYSYVLVSKRKELHRTWARPRSGPTWRSPRRGARRGRRQSGAGRTGSSSRNIWKYKLCHKNILYILVLKTVSISQINGIFSFDTTFSPQKVNKNLLKYFWAWNPFPFSMMHFSIFTNTWHCYMDPEQKDSDCSRILIIKNPNANYLTAFRYLELEIDILSITFRRNN